MNHDNLKIFWEVFSLPFLAVLLFLLGCAALSAWVDNQTRKEGAQATFFNRYLGNDSVYTFKYQQNFASRIFKNKCVIFWEKNLERIETQF